MFLRHTKRNKNGKVHRYWSIVENRRLAGGTIYQRPVLYLGEINDQQESNWRKTISVFSEDNEPEVMELFPDDVAPKNSGGPIVQIRLREMELLNPRQWGACWLACHLYQKLGLDGFWKSRLQPSRKGTHLCPAGRSYVRGQALLKQRQSLSPRQGAAHEVSNESDELAAQLQGEFGDEVKGMVGNAPGCAHRGG